MPRSKVRSGKVGHVQMIKTTSRDSPLPSLDYLKIRKPGLNKEK